MAAAPESLPAMPDPVPALRQLCRRVAGLDVEVHVSRSCIELRRQRTFAVLWDADRYIEGTFPVALSILLPCRLASTRVGEPQKLGSRTWWHHLSLRGPEDVDPELLGWLERACVAAS